MDFIGPEQLSVRGQAHEITAHKLGFVQPIRIQQGLNLANSVSSFLYL